QPVGAQNDRQRVAGQGPIGEDVDPAQAISSLVIGHSITINFEPAGGSNVSGTADDAQPMSRVWKRGFVFSGARRGSAAASDRRTSRIEKASARSSSASSGRPCATRAQARL